ncbi:unnamed protein product, partial [Urochloa humidicola]
EIQSDLAIQSSAASPARPPSEAVEEGDGRPTSTPAWLPRLGSLLSTPDDAGRPLVLGNGGLECDPILPLAPDDSHMIRSCSSSWLCPFRRRCPTPALPGLIVGHKHGSSTSIKRTPSAEVALSWRLQGIN